jgi:hypothetical protein
LLGLTAFAAAPPALVSLAVLKLIDQLGEDADTRKSAEKKLTNLGEDIVPVLRKAARTHSDIDVRLRMMVVTSTIEKGLFGEVK